jgi:signal transduction histidine kinase
MKANNLRKLPDSIRSGAMAREFNSDSVTAFDVTSATWSWTRSAAIEMSFPQMKDAIVVCDTNGAIVLTNTSAKVLTQRDQDPEGKPMDFAEDIWGELLDRNGSPIAAEEWPVMRALRGESVSYEECRLVRPNGGVDILFSASPILGLAGRIVGAVATLTDITTLKRDDALLHEQALERERSRMATHIHDTVSQSLTAITLQLQAAERELQQSPETAGIYMQSAVSVARETLADLRRCIWTLSHETLEGDDLAEALSFLAERLFDTTPVELKLSVQRESGTLPHEIRHEILWIGKEAMANILKHAHATKVHIELLCGNKKVQLCIDDNGHGFQPTPWSRNKKGSFGLISMRKRAERLGGTVEIDSQRGKGTRVVAVVPYLQH